LIAFVSHNKTDKEHARFLAMALVGLGANVWFDEWDIQPGDSIVGGIEEGISRCSHFVLIWSSSAAASKWVGTEVRAIIRRRVDNEELKIIPIIVDDTERLLALMEKQLAEGDPLPYLVCPRCGSSDLNRGSVISEKSDREYYVIECKECGWGTWSE